MSKNLQEYRKSYEKGALMEAEVSEDPMVQFKKWFDETEASEKVEEINAMTLSTIGVDGFPRGRIVLLKEIVSEGFIFYTNYSSEKGKSIAGNDHICISFFWPEIERQIIIKGKAEKVSAERSRKYFSSRPRESQLGALASQQSTVVSDRETLENKLAKLEKKYKGKDIPKPPHWGGYIVIPVEFEFWQGRSSRLHDRIQYRLENAKWVIRRLQP